MSRTAEQFPYRMQDLVQATGASRETIRYYINEGLLPEPHRTARNSAWYGDAHIEQIRLIRELQEKHYLPLKAIRTLMDDPASGDFTPSQRRVFNALLNRSRRDEGAGSGKTLSEVCAETGVTRIELEQLQSQGLLSDVDEDAWLGGEEEELLRLWVTVREAGLTPERGFSPADVAMLGDAADILLNQMVRNYTERLEDFSLQEAEALWETILPAVERAFSILLERRVRGFVTQLANQQSGHTDKTGADHE